jgi:methionyl aminopeptidase
VNDKKFEAMRYAGKVNLKAITKAKEFVQEGVALEHIDTLIEGIILSEGCEPAFKGYKGYPATACISVNDVAVHGIPNDYVLQPGDIVTIDVGTRYNGFCVDAARTFVIDQRSMTKQYWQRISLWNAVEAVIQAELDVIKDGVSLYDIADAGDKESRRQDVNLMIQWGGHCIGETIHIDPFIPNGFDYAKGSFGVELEKRRLRTALLSAGQVICLEPVVTFGATDTIIDEDGWTVRSKDGSDVAHTERCLIITKEGYELLS